MSINKRKRDVFELLSRGAFICSNSSKADIQKLYVYIDESFEDLEKYFAEINYNLSRGDEFFYFSRIESKADMTRKLDKAFKWIDLLDFFLTYNTSFAVGFRFDPQEITVALKVNAALKNKLISSKLSKSKKELDKVRDLIKLLEKDGFVEMENELSESYKVLASFSYMSDMVYNINLQEE